MNDYYDYPEYIPVQKRIARARKESQRRLGKKQSPDPVVIEGRGVAKSFWGKGWCDHMESFHDYENRLPRGKNYVRNGSVVHLEIAPGKIRAHVAGTSMYVVTLEVKPVPPARWKALKQACAGQIASLVDLLQGKLSDGVMRQVARRDGGLYPQPREIEFDCSCPDGASMCKHVAAACYGVGARLDRTPELLFALRGVDPAELAADVGVDAVLDKGAVAARAKRVGGDLAAVFGIDLDDDTPVAAATAKKRPRTASRKASASRIQAMTETPAKPKLKTRSQANINKTPQSADAPRPPAIPAKAKKTVAAKKTGEKSPAGRSIAPAKKKRVSSPRLRARRDNPEAGT